MPYELLTCTPNECDRTEIRLYQNCAAGGKQKDCCCTGTETEMFSKGMGHKHCERSVSEPGNRDPQRRNSSGRADVWATERERNTERGLQMRRLAGLRATRMQAALL